MSLITYKMKTNRYLKHLTASLTLAMGLLGCTNDFEELNTSPTQPAAVPAEYVLTNVQMNGIMAEGGNWWQVGSWVEQWASGSLSAPSQYQEDRDIYETRNWASHYSYINNLAQIRNRLLKGQEETAAGRTKLAIAKINEIYLWQRMTDFWGDIPYSESAQTEAEMILTPKYDAQKDIYASLLADLDAAAGRLNSADLSYGVADVVYKGNVDAWRKFANMLKLRMGFRLRFVDETWSRKVVEEALKGPIFASNADNAQIVTNPQDGFALGYHPVISGYNGSKELNQLAEPFITTLLTKNDPRLPRIAEPTENSKKAGAPIYRGLGVALGQNVTVNRDDYSYGTISIYNDRKATFPYLFMAYSDLCFYKAEAALLGWAGLTPADAKGFYQAGIRAAMQTDPYKIDAATIDAYLAKEGLLTGTSEQQLEQIMVQKWISLFMRHYEAYSEWRRTGYPKLVPGPNKGVTNGQIPRRAVYSGSERFRNPEEYNAASKVLANGDTYLSKVWWDVR
jgi:hypothetical protein